MTAFVVKEPYSALDEEGVMITIPKGARVEEGSFFLLQDPSQWIPEEEPNLFRGREFKGLTVIPRGEGVQPITVELSTGETQVQPSMENIAAWLDAEDAWKEAELARQAAEATEQKASTGIKRSLPRQPRKG